MIKTHKHLAEQIAGRKVLHLNSLGKDSVLCLDWLHNYARPSEIISINFRFMAPHPQDDSYFEFLKKAYPQVTYFVEPNPWEISQVLTGMYQLPTDVYGDWNSLEYDTIEPNEFIDSLRLEHGCDYVCKGQSRYESFSRATFFHKKGILDGTSIYPLGMMSKDQVQKLIKHRNIKLHPQYKLTKSTLDFPSYYKMRAWFLANPSYKKAMYRVFPMLQLDEYRYEKLLK